MVLYLFPLEKFIHVREICLRFAAPVSLLRVRAVRCRLGVHGLPMKLSVFCRRVSCCTWKGWDGACVFSDEGGMGGCFWRRTYQNVTIFCCVDGDDVLRVCIYFWRGKPRR